ncbi:MAG: aminotransferase class I/II-fold pyridoxal phosphate-dependent enzyme, partial [Chloroflexota bacterium]
MKFSSRLNWNLTPNPLTQLLDAKRAQGIPILDLTESNPTRARFTYDDAAILSAMAQPQAMKYEPSPRGLLSAREAITNYYLQKNKRVDADSIFLTASTSEAYSFLFKLLGDAGDEILVPQPSYPLFEFLAGLESLKTIHYPLRYTTDPSGFKNPKGLAYGWQINFEVLRE